MQLHRIGRRCSRGWSRGLGGAGCLHSGLCLLVPPGRTETARPGAVGLPGGRSPTGETCTGSLHLQGCRAKTQRALRESTYHQTLPATLSGPSTSWSWQRRAYLVIACCHAMMAIHGLADPHGLLSTCLISTPKPTLSLMQRRFCCLHCQI